MRRRSPSAYWNRRLLRIIDGEQVDTLRLELSTRLAVRGSTAAPRTA
ncbi:hypothetical protein OHS17_28550 [Streptomyces sp. NBC_00523]|nr:hypothetical protein [Streptomyces sp. NBC_00523]WUD03348.1 hypothetical protein OHS17_28550 [Streptomyces sp. NBC_00523]